MNKWLMNKLFLVNEKNIQYQLCSLDCVQSDSQAKKK